MPILLNIYLMHISFVKKKKKSIWIGYIAVTWGVLSRYNDKQSLWERYFLFKNTNKWWWLQFAYDKKQLQTQRVKLFSFGHTEKTTKQNNKNPDSYLKNYVGHNANSFLIVYIK